MVLAQLGITVVFRILLVQLTVAGDGVTIVAEAAPVGMPRGDRVRRIPVPDRAG